MMCARLLGKEDYGDENVMGALLAYDKQGFQVNYLGKDVNVEFSLPRLRQPGRLFSSAVLVPSTPQTMKTCALLPMGTTLPRLPQQD
jgi:hypothetical protein